MSISRGRIGIECGQGVRVLCDGVEITAGNGLQCLCRRGASWEDLSGGAVSICRMDGNAAAFSIGRGPVTQRWAITVEEDSRILWTVDCETSDGVPIDEIRCVCNVKAVYKSWVCEYHQGDFRRTGGKWEEVPVPSPAASLVGLRFPCGGSNVPAISLEPASEHAASLFPVILQSSACEAVQAVGFGMRTGGAVQGFRAGLSLMVGMHADPEIDEKMEVRRRQSVERVLSGPSAKRALKVLLLNLPWKRGDSWGVRAGSRWPHIKSKEEENYLPFPFFLAYAAALLRKNGVQAQLIDALAARMPENDLREKIAAAGADLVVAETSTPSFDADMECLRTIAALQVPIALCGPHAPMYEEKFLLDNAFVDYVLCGEYEETLLELVTFLQTGAPAAGEIRGLIRRDGDRAVKNPGRDPGDINRLPWPLRDGLPMRRYMDAPGEMPLPCAQMTASRGCPFCCTFCLWPQIMFKSRNYRARYVPDVLDEMEFLVKEKGFRSVYFDDDTFNVGKERMLEFCRGLTERGLHHTPWAIMARPDLMDEEILHAMKGAGLWAVKYGVESADQSLLDGIRKNMDLKKTIRMVEYTNRLGIRTHLTFTFGLPGETLRTVDATIALARRLNPFSVQFSITTPFPETEFFTSMEREGKIVSRNWVDYDGNSAGVVRSGELTAGQLASAQIRAYRLWNDHCRRRRGVRGDVTRFITCCRAGGLGFGMTKAVDYLRFVLLKRGQYLRGE